METFGVYVGPTYYFLCDKQGTPLCEEKEITPLFHQSERIDDGHNVHHIKGHYTLQPGSITLIAPTYSVSYDFREEEGQGTDSWKPAGYRTNGGNTVILYPQENRWRSSGSGECLYQIDMLKVTISYEANVIESVTYWSDNFSYDQGNLTFTHHRLIRWRGRPETHETGRMSGVLYSDVKLSDTTTLENIFNGRLEALFDHLVEGDEPSFHGNYSYVCADACNTIMYPHHNVVLNTMEVLNLKSSVGDMYQDFLKLVTDKDKTKKLRQIASAYLGTKYGPRLTISEAVDILECEKSYSKKGTATGTRGTHWSYYTFSFDAIDRVSFSYEYGCYLSFQNALGSWGLSPLSLEDVWDAVPYSFVVDWFFDVSDRLENSRRKDFVDHLPVSHIWRSEKSICDGSITHAGSKLCYSFNIYCRESMQGLSSNLAGYTSSPGITAQGHIPEIGAVAATILA
jgi:hypothetical protein